MHIQLGKAIPPTFSMERASAWMTMTYKYDENNGRIFDEDDGQTIATMSDSATPQQAQSLVTAYNSVSNDHCQAMIQVIAGMLGAAEADGMDDKSNVWRSLMISARQIVEDADIKNGSGGTNSVDTDIVDSVILNLNIFDADGSIVDGVTSTVSINALSDIVDHASQLVLLKRSGNNVDQVFDELEESLVVADVIAEH